MVQGTSMLSVSTSEPHGLDDQAVVRRLSGEFSAPVGLVDPATGGWSVRPTGAPEEYPSPGLERLNAAEWGSRGSGRASLCRGTGVDWLTMPIDRPAGRVLALAGFSTVSRFGSSTVASPFLLGPACPPRALLAWGQQMLDQIHREFRAHPYESLDLQLVARLIRRVRISDPPDRFQQIATSALRSTMAIHAAAWVPCHDGEPVVLSGGMSGIHPKDYRALIPASPKDSPKIVNDPAAEGAMYPVRSIAVGSDGTNPVGWLVVVNPLGERPFSQADAELMFPIAALLTSQHTNARVYADLKDLLFGVIRALTAAIDAKDPYTSGHSERVARIAVRLATELSMSANQRGDLYLTGLMHDVGKIGVDDAILKKTGPLTPEEYRQIQMHVEIGVHILSGLKKLNHILPGVRHHHESYDGSGYPTGLKGEGIPYEARILAVADSYDAMSSTRPYRRRMTPMQIDEILRKGAGVQWDAKVIDALFACRMDLEMIRQKGLGESLQLAVTGTLGRS